jgi:hypothetical protein
MQLKKNYIIFGFVAFFIFFLLAIYITYPLIFNMGSLVTGQGDELVIAWIQNWVIHALSTNPFALFEANLYFPYHSTLAYSDLFLTSSILSIIPLKLIGEPIAAVNFTLISSLVLFGFSIYLLCFYITRDFLSSFIAGVLVIFSPAVLDKTIHLQILSIQWVPLAILFFLIFIKNQKTKFLAISLLFFLLQTYNSFLPGYFILFSYLIIFLYSWFIDKKKTKRLITKKNILFFTLSFALIIPIALPYYSVSKEFAYTRDIRDAIHFAIQPEDLLYPGATTRLKDYLLSLPFNQFSQNGEFKPGYLGFVFSLLCVFAFYYFIKNLKKNGLYITSFITTALAGLILSLGPVLHLGRQTIHDPFPIVLPYTLFYYILPGFQGFRNSARWEMLFILMIVVVIALTLHNLLKRYSLVKRVAIYLLLLIGIVAEFNFPMHFEEITQRKDFPQVYSWLNTTPKNSAVIIMPIYNWNMAYPGEEMKREYFSTENFRRTVNGYTGFSPPPWQELLTRLHEDFPNDKSIKEIRSLGVDYIIVDKSMYDKGFKEKKEKVNGSFIIDKLKKSSSLKFVKKLDSYYIFTYRTP